MRAAARAASSLANNWTPPLLRAARARRIVKRSEQRWWRKRVIVTARDIARTARTACLHTVPVVVVELHCRVVLPIIGAAPGDRKDPQSSTWRLAGAAGFRGVWQAGPCHGIPVPRA